MSFPTSPPIRHTPRAWSFPEVCRVSTPWGLKISAVEMRGLPLVHVRWTFRGGRVAAADHAPGAGRLLANVARHGTHRYSSEGLASALDQLGAKLRVNVSQDQCTAAITGQAAHLPLLLDLVEEVAFRPTFPEVELARERASALEVHDSERVHAETVAARWLTWTLFPGHPYGAPPTTAEGLRGATQEQIRALHRRLFAPERGLLTVVGDVDAPEALSALASRYASAPTAAEALPLCPPAPLGARRRLIAVDRPGSEQVAVAVGHAALTRAHPDYTALRVVNQAFGAGASSRLFLELRERRSLTYGCYSALDAGLVGGDLISSLSTAPAKASTAVGALLDEWARLRAHGLPDAELEPARRYLVGSFPQSASGVGGISALVSLAWLADLPDDTWPGYPSRVAAIDEAQAAGAITRWIHPEEASVVAVGPIDVVRAALEPHGEVELGTADAPEYEGATAGSYPLA